MKKTYPLFILLLGMNISAQVGININNPKSSLHIQKRTELTFPDGIIPPRISGDSLRMKAAAYSAAQNGAIVYVTSPVTNPDPLTEPKTQDVGSRGFFVYDANYTHPNTSKGVWNKVMEIETESTSGTYALKASGNVALISLSLNLLGSNVNYIPLTNTSTAIFNVEIPSSQISSNVYNVPSDGIYHINYSFRTGQGVSAELLTGARPGLIITKTAGAATTALDYRYFGSVNLLDLGSILGIGLVVANVTLTQGQISHIYKLKAGDILRFGIVQGGLSLGAITDKSAELSIYKIR
ncbi:hypothetical protein [Chryseobacterium chendengshani]|uniref:hypothetical protein n=1 Tax=Chryseobacterium sp. LJ756 TaxID=2864113 RepID=UPI001C642237|nr:hypothetical protein [Chryseobacterium sp. LJ756]MBW7676936.1 hypothetical protein [Chryseobacterium sp. LJ756]